MFLFQKQLKRILLQQEFIMTELADVRAKLKEAEVTIGQAINGHMNKHAKPVASSQDLDMLIAEIAKFTEDTVAAVAALSPPVPEATDNGPKAVAAGPSKSIPSSAS